MRARARSSSTLSVNSGSSTKMPARREGSFAVLSHVHCAPDGIAVYRAFERITDLGSFVTMRTAAAQLRSLDRTAHVARKKFAAMIPLQLAARLLEKQRVDRM